MVIKLQLFRKLNTRFLIGFKIFNTYNNRKSLSETRKHVYAHLKLIIFEQKVLRNMYGLHFNRETNIYNKG